MSFRALYSSPLLRMLLDVSCRGHAAIIKFSCLLSEDHLKFQIPCFQFISKFLQYSTIAAGVLCTTVLQYYSMMYSNTHIFNKKIKSVLVDDQLWMKHQSKCVVD